MTDGCFRSIQASWGGYVLTVLLLLGPAFLVSAPFESSNAGLLPFLLSPFVVSVFVPYVFVNSGDRLRGTVLASLWYSLVMGLVFILTYLIFGSPRLLDLAKGVLLLFSLAWLLSGLYLVVCRLSDRTVFAQWTATTAGLLITGSFIYLSPAADLLYADRFTRELVIGVATYLNPVLAMSGSILRQDLLRGEFLYEHLSIGRYYAYSAPPWHRIVLTYLITGGGLHGIAGWAIEPESPSNHGPSDSEERRDAEEQNQ